MSIIDEKTDTSFSMRDFYYVLFRYKCSMVAFFFVSLFTIVVGVYLWPESYSAKARILVKMGRENVALPIVAPVSQQQVVVSLGLRKEDINSEIEILTSKAIAEEAVRHLGTDFLFPKAARPKTFFRGIKYDTKQVVYKVRDFIYDILYKIDFKKKLSIHDGAVLALQSRLSAKQIRLSDVVEVQFTWYDPTVAREILDTLMDFYMSHHSQAHRISGGHDFFQKQVEVLEKRLNDSEDKLKSLKEAEEITSYEHQSRLLLEQLIDFRAAKQTIETDLAEASKRIDQLREKKGELRSKIPTGFGTVYKEAERELMLEEVRVKGLAGKKEKLEQHVQFYLEDLKKLRLPAMQLKRLERQVRIDERNYELYCSKLEETRVSDVLDAEKIVNVRVIDAPAASPIPVRPRKLLIIGVGVVLSLLVAVALAFLSEYFDHSIRTAEHVSTYLDLPLLASIREGNK